MKLCVWSDLHLGRTLYRSNQGELNRFEKIGYETFDRYIDEILKENPDILINLGDTFETSNPSIIALNKFSLGMTRLKDIPQLVILGNHDYNHKNRTENCSAVDTILQTTEANVLKFADYQVEYYEQDDCLFVLLPYIYDSKDMIVKLWEDVKKIMKEHSSKRNFLITHGVTEQYAKNFLGFENEHIKVPDNILEKFDMCLIGHIHKPMDYKVKGCRVISPGAMIDWAEYEDETGLIVIDTDKLKVTKNKIQTVRSYSFDADEDDINDILGQVTENIYRINFDGDTSAIDNSKFITAKNTAVNLTLNIQRFDKEEDLNSNTEQKSIKDFIGWIGDNYPDKVNKFKEAKEKCVTQL